MSEKIEMLGAWLEVRKALRATLTPEGWSESELGDLVLVDFWKSAGGLRAVYRLGQFQTTEYAATIRCASDEADECMQRACP